MNETDLFHELRRSFPELLSDLDDGVVTGLLHPEMGVLAAFARRAVSQRDHRSLGRAIAFAEAALRVGTPTVQNAVYVSFLETVFLDATDAHHLEAEALLPPALKIALGELRADWARIERHASDRK